MKLNVGRIAKAINAAVIAGGGTTTTALLDGKIEPAEVVAIVVATVVAFCGVYATPNDPAPVEAPQAVTTS